MKAGIQQNNMLFVALFFLSLSFHFFTQDLFVLLDLLGGADPLITNHFDNTARWFDRLVAAGESLSDQTASDVPLHVPSFLPINSAPSCLRCSEKRLHRQGLLASHPSEQAYFRKDVYLGPVQDDHIPFLHRGESDFLALCRPAAK